MRFPRLRMAALAVVVAGTALGGCDSGALDVSPSTATGSGVYTLMTVNAKPLPVELRNDATGRLSIISGSLQISGGTFQQSLTLSDAPVLGSVSLRGSSTHGTVTVRGDRVEFHASDGGEWEGVISGNRLDYAVPGNSGPVAFSFQR